MTSAREDANRCPACGAMYCKGALGSGTLIEVKCRRCKQQFVVAVPKGRG